MFPAKVDDVPCSIELVELYHGYCWVMFLLDLETSNNIIVINIILAMH
jgi:hypothetical protein